MVIPPEISALTHKALARWCGIFKTAHHDFTGSRSRSGCVLEGMQLSLLSVAAIQSVCVLLNWNIYLPSGKKWSAQRILQSQFIGLKSMCSFTVHLLQLSTMFYHTVLCAVPCLPMLNHYALHFALSFP